MCAHAVRVAMKKLPGVEEVHVSLQKAVTDIRLGAGNAVTLVKLRDTIKRSGFKAGEAEITARGRFVDDDGKLTLDLAPAKASVRVREDSGNADALVEARKLRKASTIVEVTGILTPDDMLTLHSLTQIKLIGQ